MEVDDNVSNEAGIQRLRLNSEGTDSHEDISSPGDTQLPPEEVKETDPAIETFSVNCSSPTSKSPTQEIMCRDNNDTNSHLHLSPPVEDNVPDSLVRQMLERLSHSSAHFKHQQRNEPDLTPEQKYDIARSVFEKNPGLFLSRFKEHLSYGDVACFQMYRGDYEVDFHLNEMLKWESTAYKRNKVKNRRYKALLQMMSLGDDYFTEDAMKARDPLLYEELIGQHLTEEERVQKANDILAENENFLSHFLMKHIEQQHENDLYYKLKDRQEECLEECDSDTDDEIDLPGDKKKVSKAEKKDLKVEFLQIMQERFLDGKDTDYDYSTIDNNDMYDDLDTEEKDEEEKYFDDEEPQFMDDTNVT